MKRKRPEQEIQRTIAVLLDLHGVRWCHVPNGGARSATEAGIFRSLGVKPGVPDILIFDPPRNGGAGAAIELKAGRGKPSPAQSEWLDALRARGWQAKIAHGLDEALADLRNWGYIR